MKNREREREKKERLGGKLSSRLSERIKRNRTRGRVDKTGGESWGEPNRRNGTEETVGQGRRMTWRAVIKAVDA